MIIERLSQIPPGGYDNLMLDTPTPFEVWSRDTGLGRAAESHYPTMTWDDLYALPIKRLAARHCFVWLWATACQLKQTLALGEAWGFTYKTIGFDWTKTTKGGQPAWGMGHYTRQNNELVLLYVNGRPRRASAAVHMTVWDRRGPHSQKPDTVQERIERFNEGDEWYLRRKLDPDLRPTKTYLEVFARRERPGWDAIGNELGNHLDIRDVLAEAWVG